jgi:hypothetical protein
MTISPTLTKEISVFKNLDRFFKINQSINNWPISGNLHEYIFSPHEQVHQVYKTPQTFVKQIFHTYMPPR